jgi:SAM-dependent methyltransferase
MWDTDEAVARYEAWYASPKGAFALEREKLFLAHMVSSWPRRTSSLLEIGCGAGHFLELFWEAGFDVSGIDASRPMLDAAKKRLGCRVELHLGNAGLLPIDDQAFDYAVLVTALECMENPEEVVAETFRIASKGVLIAFLSRWSLYWVEKQLSAMAACAFAAKGRRQEHAAAGCKWFSPLQMWKLSRKVSGRPAVFRSTLFAPSPCWRKNSWLPSVAPRWSIAPFGAVAAVRTDLTSVPVTPVVLRVSKAAPVAQ